MFKRKPTSKILSLAFTLLLILTLSIPTIASVPTDTDDDSSDLEQLLALDDELEEQNQQHNEAEVLSKAQRIVLELDTDNTKKGIEGNEFVLVLGYAPWCPRSAELMPHFAEAATILKELGSHVLMAKLDAERYPKVASMLDIKGFPTLLLFVNGTSQAYTGGFSAEEIVLWARKRTGVPVVRINSVAEAEGFLRKYRVFVIGLFEKYMGPEHDEFVNAATSDNEIQFAEASNIQVANVLFPNITTTKPFLGIVKSEPEIYTTYEGAFEVNKILKFLDYNKFPLIIKLTEMNSVRVHSSPIKLQVMVFAEADEFQKLLEPLQDIARKFKFKIMFIYIDIADENLAKPFLTLFGVEESKGIVVAAFDNKISSKFLLESAPTPSNIEGFCSGLLHGIVSTYYKSQPIPDNKDASIQVIVGKTFDNLVLSSPKNVLLEVYTPWCINCETTSKQVEKLAKHFKGSDNIVFARIDASVNEHPKLQIDDYPTLLFYAAADKANPIKLSTKSSSKDLAMFISKHLRAKDEVTKDEL
ncbi:Thioredoxin domain-containing protein/Thioredoxin_6 domain-containing protein [Cephalotus follicularis]|uniref:protein disulfide-isomerase n=1 Tax=Cephalotus follicularis TaxID=3775 RepID=A0A1Q3B923_CEPFO|nr:Thioredoxin domain-containing protein/Thioredoxin_6 domain-containing protein [Cephalotus follicularis]